MKTLRILWYFLGVVGIALILFAIFFFPAKIVVPEKEFQEVKIDGKAVGSGIKKVWPGNHTLEAKKMGFVPYKKTQKLRINEKIDLTGLLLKQIPSVEKALDGAVSTIALNRDGKSINYLDNGSGQLRAFLEGKTKSLTPEGAFKNVEKIIYSPDQELAMLKKPEETGLYDFKRYDLLHQEYHRWGPGIGDVVWDMNLERVFYYNEPGTGERSIVKSNFSHDQIERLFLLDETPISNPQISISPDGKELLLTADKIYKLDVVLKELTPISSDGFAAASWNSDGSLIAGFRNNGEVVILNKEGKEGKHFSLNTGIEQFTWLSPSRFLVISGKRILEYDAINGEETEYFYSGDISGAREPVKAEGKLYFVKEEGLYSLLLASNKY